MMDSFSSLVLLLAALLGSCNGLCPDGWVYFQNSCYLFSHDAKPFTESKMFCLLHGAHLVKVETQVENIFVKSSCAELKDNPHWIGLTDADIEGIWQWSDGTTSSFMDWYPGEPNGGDSANCVALWIPFNYAWADGGCDASYMPICERPQFTGESVIG